MRNPATMVNAGARILVCLAWLAAGTVTAEETTKTTTTTTTTNPDGTTTTTVKETTTTPEPSTQQQPASQPQAKDPNLVGPTGATGVIRRSDRRQDRRAGDPRVD